MRIDRLDVHYVVMPLIYPWRTAYGVDVDIHSVLVKLSSGEHTAWSESTPFFAPHYLSESAGSVFYHVTEVFGPHVVGREFDTAADINERLDPFKGNSFAKAAIEIGWWTLESRITGTPLHRLLGGTTRAVVAGADFGIQDSIEMLLGNIGQAVDAGFPRIKLKVARGWDLEMLRQVTSTFPDMTFHIDCNAGYTLDDLPFFRAIDDLGLAFIEQPLHYTDILDHAELAKRIGTPICLDETIVDPRTAEQAIRIGACRYINIKPARVGGLQNALAIHDMARDAGIPVWIGGHAGELGGRCRLRRARHPRQRHLPRRPVPLVPLLHAGPRRAAAGIRRTAHVPSVRVRSAGAGPGDARHVDATARGCDGGGGTMSTEPAAGLSAQQTDDFQRDGYVVLEGFLAPGYNERLIAEVDELMADRANGAKPLLTSYREMGLLTSHPPMMAMIESLMGPRFAMHHIHSARHDAGERGVHWHQDYEQEPHTNRSHVMVHVFYYLNGLNGEIGDLLVLPGSQTVVVETSLALFGTEDLPGSVCVDRLPPGSAVIVHSAVWHARRAKPGGEQRGRYFIDVSYCQHGVLWPAYGTVEEVNREALRQGFDRGGRYRHVYDSTRFFDRRPLKRRFDERNEGSMLLRLKDE